MEPVGEDHGQLGSAPCPFEARRLRRHQPASVPATDVATSTGLTTSTCIASATGLTTATCIAASTEIAASTGLTTATGVASATCMRRMT